MTKISERAMAVRGQETSTGIALQDQAAPDWMTMQEDETAGQGVSTAAADNTLPMIVLLQPNSPQLSNPNDPNFFESGRPGDIWLRGLPRDIELVKGTVGIEAQVVYFYRHVVEWVPRDQGGGGGSGFVCVHQVEEARHVSGARNAIDPKTGAVLRNDWVTPEGNDLVETRYFVLKVRAKGQYYLCLMALTGTGHKPAKDWMADMNNDRDAKGRTRAAYSRLWRLTTQRFEGKGNQWWQYVRPTMLGWVPEKEFAEARALLEQFKSQERSIGNTPERETGSNRSGPQTASTATQDAHI